MPLGLHHQKSQSVLQLQIINSHTLLGFSKSENIIEIPCTSSKPINVMAITNILLHLEPGYDLNINYDEKKIFNHIISINKCLCLRIFGFKF